MPLTMRSISCVAASLKEGCYSSAADYSSTAQAQHLKSYEWASMLAWQHTVCLRSALRGIGGAKQTEELLLVDFTTGAVQIEAHFDTPVGVVYSVVVAYFFMMREIELSTLLSSSVTLCMVRRLVTIWLPASKTDPEALSVTRTWGCVCPEGEGPDAHSCAFHAAVEQTALLKEKFGERVGQDGFPFMPTKSGSTCSKAQVVAGVRRAARKAGRRATNEEGE